jgi:hypothetical protein
MIDNVTSRESVADPDACSISVVSITILLPAITSTEAPAGIGISLMIYVSSPELTNLILAVILDPNTLANVQPSTTVVVPAGTVYTGTRVVSMFAKVFLLNVFAMLYPIYT